MYLFSLGNLGSRKQSFLAASTSLRAASQICHVALPLAVTWQTLWKGWARSWCSIWSRSIPWSPVWVSVLALNLWMDLGLLPWVRAPVGWGPCDGHVSPMPAHTLPLICSNCLHEHSHPPNLYQGPLECRYSCLVPLTVSRGRIWGLERGRSDLVGGKAWVKMRQEPPGSGF